MKLFVDSGYLSPYAMSVFVALREKNVSFELEPIDLARGQHRSAAYAMHSHTLRVPTISDGALNLSESSAICEYLDEVHPGTALFPTSPQLKAKAREVQAWLRSDLMPIRAERSTEVVFLLRDPPPLSGEAQTASAKLFSAVEAMLQDGQQNLFGAWSIADTDLALMLNRLVLAGDSVPDRLAAYARAQWQRPSVQEWARMPRSPR